MSRSTAFLALLLAALCISCTSASTFNLRRGVTQLITRGLKKEDGAIPEKVAATDADATADNETEADGNETDIVDNIADSNTTIDDGNATVPDNNETIDDGNSTIVDSNATIEDSNSTSDGNETAGETASMGTVLYTLTPAKDTYMDDEEGDKDFGDASTLQVRNKNQEDLVSIIQFNLTGLVIEGGFSAMLNLKIKSVKGNRARNILVKRLEFDSEWSEDIEGEDLEELLEDVEESMDEVKSVAFTVAKGQVEAQVDITTLVGMEDESLNLVLEGEEGGPEARTAFCSANSDCAPTLTIAAAALEDIDNMIVSTNETVVDNGDNTNTTNVTDTVIEVDVDDEPTNTTNVTGQGEDDITAEAMEQSSPAQDFTDAESGLALDVETLEKKAKFGPAKESP